MKRDKILSKNNKLIDLKSNFIANYFLKIFNFYLSLFSYQIKNKHLLF